MPDPELEAYQTGKHPRIGREVELRLRGGGEADDDDSLSEDGNPDGGDISAAASSQLSLRGGAADGSFVSNEPEETVPSSHSSAGMYWSRQSATPRLGGETFPITEQWIPLYGYQGVVWFRIDMLYTFVDAVDRLLCLDNRAGVTYSLYLLDKGKNYETQAERDAFLQDEGNNGITLWCSGAGDYSHDHLAWEWVIDKFNLLGDAEKGPEAHRKVFFVAGPDDPIPWTWEPGPSHKVMKVVLDWVDEPEAERPDVAYLRMPDNAGEVVDTNVFSQWMRHVCRVLAPGRIPGRPGYPAIPDAWFSVADSTQGGSPYPVGTYGGLIFPSQSWHSIVERWETNKVFALRLQARTRTNDCWHLFIPGASCPYEKQYIMHRELGDVQSVRRAIMDLVQSSMSPESFSQLKSLEIYLPGSGFFLQPENGGEEREKKMKNWIHSRFIVSLTARNLDLEFRRVVDRLVLWKTRLERKPGVPPAANGLGLFPQFITIRPLFKRYIVRGSGAGTKAWLWDPDTSDITKFRLAGAKIPLKGKHGEAYSPENSLIGVTQGGPGKTSATPSRSVGLTEGKSTFVIGPDTDDEEWRWVRRMIVQPEVFVSVVDEDSMPRKERPDSKRVRAC